ACLHLPPPPALTPGPGRAGAPFPDRRRRAGADHRHRRRPPMVRPVMDSEVSAMRPLLLLLTLLGGTDKPGDEDGFVSLFDGKSLDGWRRFGGKADAWAVADGLLVSVGEGGGWLGTGADHADFVLRLEFRLTRGSNSGVYLRAPADTSHISRTG